MTTAAHDYDSWIRAFNPVPGAGIRLVCFPHAGGAASFWFPLTRLLPAGVELLAVQYPGRQDRRAEPCIDDIGTLADRTAEVLRRQHPDEPLALFGHSMGAAVAFETARRLERDSGRPVAHLFVSGRRSPGEFRAEYVHLRDDDGLIAELGTLGGTAPELLADPELRDLVLPPVRSDYRAIETYRCPPDATVGCPVTVLTGDADPRVTVAEARRWEDHTTGAFDFEVFEGGHFYLEDHRAGVAGRIGDALERFL
ncbi:thioesterase II family protein [Kitasatospora sp. NBC_00315]|uniref:thioesterase II family protein n=1 Tax=Kitasatospora sp. NBC_00315 TaxID=2975963 RepID=UPI003250D509